MGEFSESLTVRILGDSQHLQKELERVEQAIRRMQSNLSGLKELGESLSRGFNRLGEGAFRPIQTLSQLLSRVQNQVDSLSGTAIYLDVSPAVQSLMRLSQLIELVRIQLLSLGGVPRGGPAPGIPGGVPAAPAPAGPIRTFAQGGIVQGKQGIDRVPAMLSRGEFVVREKVVDQVGSVFFETLNRSGEVPAETNPATPNRSPQQNNSTLPAPTTHSTTNQFGEITIQVAHPRQVNTIMRDLQLEGHRLRTRRG